MLEYVSLKAPLEPEDESLRAIAQYSLMPFGSVDLPPAFAHATLRHFHRVPVWNRSELIEFALELLRDSRETLPRRNAATVLSRIRFLSNIAASLQTEDLQLKGPLWKETCREVKFFHFDLALTVEEITTLFMIQGGQAACVQPQPSVVL